MLVAIIVRVGVAVTGTVILAAIPIATTSVIIAIEERTAKEKPMMTEVTEMIAMHVTRTGIAASRKAVTERAVAITAAIMAATAAVMATAAATSSAMAADKGKCAVAICRRLRNWRGS